MQVATPTGPRVTTAAGVPVQAFRRDDLSAGYRRLRAQAAGGTRGRKQLHDRRHHWRAAAAAQPRP